MKKICLENLELEKFFSLDKEQHKESTLFHDDTTVYKIFDDLSEKKRKRKQTKIEILGTGDFLPETVMPKDLLVYEILNNRFEGYTMDYISSSKTLYKKFSKNKKLTDLLPILIRLSNSLEEIHQDARNIISDLHAENIIIDEAFNPYFIDIDSCKIDGIKNDAIPMSFKQYLSNRNLFESLDSVETTKNTDRLCFIIMILGLMFNKHIDKIPLYQYDEKAERILILKLMREIVVEIKTTKFIPEIPYLHEIIQPSITRKKSTNK